MLPPGWTIQQTSQNARYFYHNEQEQLDVWIRPAPPPGYNGRWPLLMRASHILVKSIESRPSQGIGKPVSKNFRYNGQIIQRTK